MENNEQNNFYKYLVTGNGRSERFMMLINGARSFVLILADFFTLIPSNARARYGFFYAYWLAKFFGYELSERGYTYNIKKWYENDSWARTLTMYFDHISSTEELAFDGQP